MHLKIHLSPKTRCCQNFQRTTVVQYIMLFFVDLHCFVISTDFLSWFRPVSQNVFRKNLRLIEKRLSNFFFYFNEIFINVLTPSWFAFSTNLTEDGWQVIVNRNINNDDTGRYLEQWTKYFYMCLDSNMMRRTIKGVIVIYDMAVMNKNELLTQATPSFIRKTLHCSVNILIRILE